METTLKPTFGRTLHLMNGVSKKAQMAPGLIVEQKPPVCIAGMHRSGTSLITHLLHTCGLDLGQEQDIITPRAKEPRAYWENVLFVRLNEQILKEMGASWDKPPREFVLPSLANLKLAAAQLVSQFDGCPSWGWKDPRNSLTLRFWLDLFPDLRVVVPLRNPLEAADSLRRRNDFPIQDGLALWQTYNQALLDSVPESNRIVTRFDSYFDAPERELRRVLDFIELKASEDQIARACALISPERRHNLFTVADFITSTGSAELVDLYMALHFEAGSQEQATDQANGATPRLDDELLALLKLRTQLFRKSDRLTDAAKEIDKLMQELNAAVAKLYRSRRWRWANPMASLRSLTGRSPIRGYCPIDNVLRRYNKWRKRFFFDAADRLLPYRACSTRAIATCTSIPGAPSFPASAALSFSRGLARATKRTASADTDLTTWSLGMGAQVNTALTRPLSFVVVGFSDELAHNILRSVCVNDPFNQLILIDNTANLNYSNLSEAINAGLDRAHHELIVVVHEDVYLPPEWQICFESALRAIEERDPDWGVLGTTGWTEAAVRVGHWRDPYGYRNTFADQLFIEAKRIDEQVMVLGRSHKLRPDPRLPGIHHIGEDLPLVARGMGLRTYVVNAQSIHKYADAQGNPILDAEDSPKIKDRTTYTYLADRACSDDYFYRKWPDERPPGSEEKTYGLARFSPEVLVQLASPVVLLAQGGSGSRLLSLLATDCNIFIGNRVDQSGDCLDMRMAVYQGVIEKHTCKARWQKELTVPRMRFAAAAMLQKSEYTSVWGFKLPESMFLMPEIHEAFPRARYVHLIRDPLTTCLRRPHMTARLDNHIGRVTLPLGYRYCGAEPAKIFQDSAALHMAYNVRHQVETVRAYCRSFLEGRYLEVRFEDVLEKPMDVLEVFSNWLDTAPADHKVRDSVDINRARHPRVTYPALIVEEVEQILAPLRKELNYLS